MQLRIREHSGFTLIEVMMVIVIIGVLAAVAATSLTESMDDVRVIETEREMEMLAAAISGDPEIMANGKRADFGYIGDVGSFPANLQALYQNPGYSTWDGPYVKLSYQQDSTGFKTDEWGAVYAYTGGVTLTSTGSGASITKKFASATSDYTLNRLRGSITDAAGDTPGLIYADSIAIAITIPNGTGSTSQKLYAVDYAGNFTLDSLPAGTHSIEVVFIPANDTIKRYTTILPRHKSRIDMKFASMHFSTTADSTATIDDTLYFSTDQSSTFSGLAVTPDDMAVFDGPASIGQIFLAGDSVFSGNENIDAFHILANGHYVISTTSAATINGLSFQDDDLIDFNPATGFASMFITGSIIFGGNENIDAVFVKDNGIVLLSTESDASIGALSFQDRDIVEYDPSSGAANIILDGSAVFTGSANINAIHQQDSDTIAISVDDASATLGAITFARQDIVKYAISTTSAVPYFDGDDYFDALPADINALHIGSGIGSIANPSAGLVGHWKLDETTDTTAADASGNNNHGILHNFAGTEWSAGKVDGALDFNGSNEYIEIPHADVLNGSTQLSYSAWIYPHSWSSTRQIMAKSVHGGGSGRAQMGIFKEGSRLYGRAETQNGRRNISAPLPNLDEWTHVAIVFDSVSFKLYVNGTVADSSMLTSTALRPTTDMICISKRVGTSQYYFDGLIDDVRIYDIAIAPSVVQTLYNMGN